MPVRKFRTLVAGSDSMELHQLRIFEAVVRHRTVTDAAVALDRAPSSVSEQIRGLERSLGVTLFERTAKGMRLTGAGERMLVWARRLLDQAEQARSEVVGGSRRLRLGALETIAATYVPRACWPGSPNAVPASRSRFVPA